ncbi:MAG TPA: response regulator transcription factor [Saprospiraceae bacterium]|nr:response regulator transcription factor [Saprospiraceae bacterium]HQW55998.1 response regulator transcription factor [Saprospiraceae bacterium]
MIIILHTCPVFTYGLRQLLMQHKIGLKEDIFCPAGNTKETLSDLKAEPRLVITSQLPEANDALDYFTQLRKKFRNSFILFITDIIEPKVVKKLFGNRLIDGVIRQNATTSEMTTAIQTVLNNDIFIDEGIDLRKSKNDHIQSVHKDDPRYLIEKLTPREREVLQLVIAGHPTRVIANKLFLSPFTIMTHRKNLLKKLGVSNSIELLTYLQSIDFG